MSSEFTVFSDLTSLQRPMLTASVRKATDDASCTIVITITTTAYRNPTIPASHPSFVSSFSTIFKPSKKFRSETATARTDSSQSPESIAQSSVNEALKRLEHCFDKIGGTHRQFRRMTDGLIKAQSALRRIHTLTSPNEDMELTPTTRMTRSFQLLRAKRKLISGLKEHVERYWSDFQYDMWTNDVAATSTIDPVASASRPSTSLSLESID